MKSKFQSVYWAAFLLMAGCSFQKLYAESVSDSLYSLCMKQGHDTEKIKCLDYKSFELSTSSPSAGLILARYAMDLSVKKDWKKGIALAANEMAVNYSNMSEFDSSIYYYTISLGIFKTLNDQKAISGTLCNLSLVYKAKGDYYKSLELANKALQLQETMKNYQSQAIIMENIGSVYMELNELKHAKSYYIKARAIYIKYKDSSGIARNMTNLGILLDKHGEYDSAIVNFNSALLITKALKRLSSVQVIYANLGISYFHKRDFQRAIEYQNLAIQYSKLLESRHSLAVDYGNIGETYLELYKNSKNESDLNKAVSYLRQGYDLCAQLGFIPPQIEFSEKLVEALVLQGKDYQLAFAVLQRGHELKDSIYSNDNQMKIARLEAQKVVKEKESELRIAKIENDLVKAEGKRQYNSKIILVLVVVLLMMVLARVYSLYRNRRKMHKQKMSEITRLQSHQLRSSVVKILSITEELLNNNNDNTSTDMKELFHMLDISAKELDVRIHEVVKQATVKE